MTIETYSLLPLITAIAVSTLAWRTGNHEAEAPRLEMVALLAGIAFWCAAYGLEISSQSLALKLFFSKLAYIGIVSIPPTVVVLALRDTGRARWTEPRHLVAYAVVPCMAMGLVASNEHHHLIWAEAWLAYDGPFVALALEPGPAYWINVIYAHACLLGATTLWVRKYRSDWELHRNEAIAVLGSLSAPWFANVAYQWGFELVPHLDLTPFAFAITATSLSLGLLRQEGLYGVVHAVRRNIVHEMSDGVVVVDMDDRLVYLNVAARGALDLQSYTPGDSIAEGLANHPELVELFRNTTHGRGEATLPNGSVFDIRVSGQLDEHGELASRVLVLRDMTDQKQAEQQIRQLAFRDSLTGLPNREAFHKALRSALRDCDTSSQTLALLFVDLDRFKHVNDTLGHGAGDSLLCQVAARFEACVRYRDTVSRTASVSRLGGDEFTILLNDVSQPLDAARVARRLLKALADPIDIEGLEVFVSASIGIAICPTDGEDVETLLRNADTAMYEAKRLGRADYQFYSARMNEAGARRLRLENGLRRASERNELVVHFQPIVGAENGDIHGAEALLRWTDPELGVIAPEEFVPIAEETGLIEAIGDSVLREACKRCVEWHEAGHTEMTVAVNLSGRQLRERDFLGRLDTILAETRLDPKWLELEITENAVMDEVDAAADVLGGIRERGVAVALDDFGTGHSSLSYLRRLPLDRIKIDRSFIAELTTDSDASALADAIIAMGKGLRLAITAEGIETVDQSERLRERGCDSLQGFYFSCGLPADEFSELLRTGIVRKLND